MKTIINKIKHFINKIEDHLFPEYSCLICGREVEDVNLLICENCKLQLIPLNGNLCEKCSMPISEGNVICDECKAQDIHFDKAVACYIFDNASAKLVYGLKYSGNKYAAKHLAMLMIKTLIQLPKFDMIISVPLYKTRQELRGYNQSALIAKELSQLTTIETSDNILFRIKETEPQQGKNKLERESNVIGAFGISNANLINDKSILLIDDVFTTGTTVNECSRILKENGAKRFLYQQF